ncbi:MAG TPA: hypothetical protein VNQ90_11420 [Chthoniobacteraceae bacterium]|nr:hypothetical protein [Chthoniobacteraceae bacterium]
MKYVTFLISFFLLIRAASAQLSVSVKNHSDRILSISITNLGDDIVFVPGWIDTGPPTILPNIETSEDNIHWKPVVIASCDVGIKWFPLLCRRRFKTGIFAGSKFDRGSEAESP